MGDGLYTIAMMWLVLELTGSTLKMATVMLCNAIPSTILGPIAGGYVDRWNRRRIMICVDLVRGILVVIIPILLTLEVLHFWHICLLGSVISVAGTFFNPALSASIPMIVGERHIMRANSFLESTSGAVRVIGLAAGGVIVGFMGIAGAIYVDSASFFISAIAIFIISIPNPERPSHSMKRGVWMDLKEGLQFVWATKVFVWLIGLAASLNFALNPIGVLAPVFSKNVLNAGVEGYGFITASLTAGGLAGLVFLSIVGNVRRRGYLILCLMFGIGLSYLLFGISISLWFALVAAFALGITINMSGVVIRTIFQTDVPNEKQGRVFALMRSISFGLAPVTIALAGVLGEFLPIRGIFLIGSCLVLITVLFASAISDIRHIVYREQAMESA